MSNESELLTINEVAKALRVDPTTVRRWAKNGCIDVVVLPHRNTRQCYRIKRATLHGLLEGTTAAA